VKRRASIACGRRGRRKAVAPEGIPLPNLPQPAAEAESEGFEVTETGGFILALPPRYHGFHGGALGQRAEPLGPPQGATSRPSAPGMGYSGLVEGG
jgi:hypothetical protein